MPIRPELRPLYPPHWRELSRRVRFERAQGHCQACQRPHLVQLRCLPDGRWFDERKNTWRDRRGRDARRDRGTPGGRRGDPRRGDGEQDGEQRGVPERS